MIGTHYKNKLPKTIVQAMQQVTDDDCYIINRRIKGVTGNGKNNNCHFNVQDLVDRIGGERISGWLLTRDKALYRNGIYVWVFHSIWKTPEGKFFDVTKSEGYGNEKLATFWHDSHRHADLAEGTAFNSVITLENEKAVQIIEKATNTRLAIEKAYWTVSNLRYFSELDDHSGVFRFLLSEYPHNRKLLEEKYNCKIEGRGFVSNNGDNSVSTEMLFDFAIS